MRQLQLTLPADRIDDLHHLVADHDGRALRTWEADTPDDPGQVYAEVNLTNRAVGEFLRAAEDLDVRSVTMAPRSMLALHPGRDEAPEDLADVEALSPQEVFLAGLQSIGGWAGFLGYAAVAGAVVWIGLIIDSVFLLIAAMLIAPFAGPAMNAALATATGDIVLFRRSIGRYVAAIGLLVAVAAGLHALLGPNIATSEMTETANISVVAILLPLAAGAAGALNLMQADRSSLVSGAATGVLVAAALAPPAGLVGTALVLGEWAMAKSGGFLLVLQLAGINLAGALVFRAWGVRPHRTRYDRGTEAVSRIVMACSAVVLGGLLVWQLGSRPELQRDTIEKEISAAMSQLVTDDPQAGLVEVNARFTRPDIPGQDTLLAIVYVQPLGGADPDALEDRLTDELSSSISDRFDVSALVSVTAIPAP